jgi:hypothetical protein
VFHLFHLGPLTFSPRRAWLVGAIDEHGGFVEPVVKEDLGEALERIVEELGDEEVALEPALAAFAPGLGVPVAPLPSYLADAPAVLAFSAVNAHESLPMGTGIRAFLEACRDYGSVAPWGRYRADQPILVHILARNRRTTREALVLGGNGEPCGLALYDRPGDALRCLGVLRTGDTRAARKWDGITLAFGAEPAWGAECHPYGVLPARVPLRLQDPARAGTSHHRGRAGALAVTLGAVALLASEPAGSEEPVESVLDVDGHEYRAIAIPPGARSSLDPPPLSKGTSREQPRVRDTSAQDRASCLQLPRREDLN